MIHIVPFSYPGGGRRVYPGFLQHAGFIAMNPGLHMTSHWKFYENLVRGDLETPRRTVASTTSTTPCSTCRPSTTWTASAWCSSSTCCRAGLWHVGGRRVAPEAITGPALLTIEGELDDISGAGQTRAVHDLCTGIPDGRKRHVTVEGAGHYGIFSGRRWREFVYPQVHEFIAAAAAAK